MGLQINRGLGESTSSDRQFNDALLEVLAAKKLNKNKVSQFTSSIAECNSILTDEERQLFAKNGTVLKRLRSAFDSQNACTVFLLISKAEYNKEELVSKFSELPYLEKGAKRSNPFSIVQYWIREFKNLKLIKKSDYSEGMESVYEYSEKYPALTYVLGNHCKSRFNESLSKKDVAKIPEFFKEIFAK